MYASLPKRLARKRDIEQMPNSGGGVIVNNVCNFKTDGFPGCSVYRATKSAVATMSQVAALEYARNNIRINSIASGLLERSRLITITMAHLTMILLSFR